MPGGKSGVDDTRVCANCAGRLAEDAPEGLCAACLLKEGLQEAGSSQAEGVETQALPSGMCLGVPPPATLTTEVLGRYTPVLETARGGMGRVWLVHDSQLGREVALKELLPGSAETRDPAAALSGPVDERFAREARVTAQLQHPAITPVYELGRRTDGTLYYTMKFVRGRTLSRAIAECRTFEDRLRLLPHFMDLCQAVAYAHSRGVIHRDLKPANVMVGEFGETVVVDWGLAKIAGEQAGAPSAGHGGAPWEGLGNGTLAGHALGTPAYMPPEQAMGRLDEVDERSDVYSLGAVLYEILTGRRPYDGDSAAAVISKVIGEPPLPTRAVEPRVPVEYARICDRAMARDRKARCGSARELAAEIENVRLRPPRTAARRFAEVVAGVLVLGLPLGMALANWRSERTLRFAMERLATKGIDVGASGTEGLLPVSPPGPRVESAPHLALDPVGELYALRWRFPGLADENEPVWRALKELEPVRRAKSLGSWPAESQARARALVSANTPLLDALAGIARLPDGEGAAALRHALVSAGDPFAAELPDFPTLRGASLMLAHRARLAAVDARYGAAIDDVVRILEIANHHAALPWLASSLRRNILTEMALEVLEVAPEIARVPVQASADLERALSPIDPRRELPRALEGEIASMLWFFDTLRRNRGAGSSSAARWIGGFGWSVYGSGPLRFWLNGDQTLYVHFMADYLEAVRRPYHEARAELERIDREASRHRGWQHPVMDLALVSVSLTAERAARVESRALLARLHLAIGRFQALHGNLPDTLTAVALGGRRSVPSDPVSGLPLVYRSSGDTYEISMPGVRLE